MMNALDVTSAIADPAGAAALAAPPDLAATARPSTLPPAARTRLLHVIPSVNPDGGGPMEGLRLIARHMDAHGHHSEIVTLDAPTATYLATFGTPVHALGPAAGSYGYTRRLVPWLRTYSARFDAVVVHGLWQYHALATWRALRGGHVPYYVFTHGMLDPWFKRTYPLKHLKKCLYWPWADYRVLRDARAVLFTCEEERLLARESFPLYRANEAVVTYCAADPPPPSDALRRTFTDAFAALRGRRMLLFIGRLHPKKACDVLIDAFARIAASAPELHLVMAGPDQVGWRTSLEALACERGIADRITWTGSLQGNLKWGAFHSSDALVLPSHQENFGIVVAEALACGLPALISNKVNIWREVVADRAGFVAEDTVDGTERLLRGWLALSDEQRRVQSAAARSSFERRFTADACVRQLLQVVGAPA